MKRKTAGELADFFSGMPMDQKVTFLVPRTWGEGLEEAEGHLVETAGGELIIEMNDTDSLNYDLFIKVQNEGAVKRGQL